MGIPPRKLSLARRAWRFLPVLAAAAVIFGFLGPTIDHHFVERQPRHSHIYLNNAAAGLVHLGLHPYEQHHHHGAVSTDESEENGILYQTSDDGHGDSGPFSGEAVIYNGLIYQLGGGDSLSLAIAAGDTPHLEAFVAPPGRPPRA